MSLSDAAVTRAAKAAYEAIHETTWDQLSDGYRAELEASIQAAAPTIKTEALTPEELGWLVDYLTRAGLKQGLLLADMLNQKFGASARRRGGAWPRGSNG